jgi:hypothetical protein
MNTMFVVGKSDRRSTTVLVLRITSGPIVGPWTLRALVSTN